MESLISKNPDFAENLLKNCAVAIFVIDVDHQVIFWNQACEELTGISASEVMGTKNHWMAFYENPRPCLSDMILDGREEEIVQHYGNYKKSVLLNEGIHSEGWFSGSIGDNKRYVFVDAAPVHDRNNRLLGAVESLQDLTENKLLEDEREKLISDLRHALGRIKTLNGLLPICAICKKIRDDKGYWNKLENYLEAHSGAEFQHCLCPACEEKFYLNSYKKDYEEE